MNFKGIIENHACRQGTIFCIAHGVSHIGMAQMTIPTYATKGEITVSTSRCRLAMISNEWNRYEMPFNNEPICFTIIFYRLTILRAGMKNGESIGVGSSSMFQEWKVEGNGLLSTTGCTKSTTAGEIQITSLRPIHKT